MAMTDADKAELKTVMSEAFAAGLALFREKTEEEAAKNPPKDEPKKEETDASPLDLAGYFLGRNK